MRNPVFRHAWARRHAGRAKSLLYTIAPRRWCGAVLPPWCGVYHLVYHMVACAMTTCHHLRGGILGCRLCPPACRRHPGRRNTGLRTAPTAYRGWKLHRLGSSLRYRRSGSDGIPNQGSHPICAGSSLDLLQKLCPAALGCRAREYAFWSCYFTISDWVVVPVFTM